LRCSDLLDQDAEIIGSAWVSVERDCVATQHGEARTRHVKLDHDVPKSSKSSITRGFVKPNIPQRFPALSAAGNRKPPDERVELLYARAPSPLRVMLLA
jgi:hypothetical protein